MAPSTPFTGFVSTSFPSEPFIMAVSPIPAGYHSITPYLIVNDGAAAIAFYTQAFGAQELFRMPRPDGKLGHAEIKIGDSIVMLADESPAHLAKSPRSYGGTPVSLMIYVTDVDATAQRAIAAGAVVVRPVQDQFYGDRSGTFTDLFGHVWTIATHVKDLSPEELKRAADAAMKTPCEA
jgi:PhnB protein